MVVMRIAACLMAALLLALVVSGCEEKPGESGTQQTSTASGAADTTGTSAGDASAADGGATAVDAGDETAADTAGATVEQGDTPAEQQERQYYSKIDTDFTFVSAEYNDDPDATLSHLRFAFDARVARGLELSEEVALSSADDVAYAELDLRQAKLRIYPIAARPQQYGTGSLGEFGVRFDGMYQVHIILPNGDTAAILGINDEGEMMSPPPGEGPSGYTVSSRHRASDYGPPKFVVYRRDGDGSRAEMIMTASFRSGGFQSHQVADPQDNVYEYRFPEGRLNIDFAPEGFDDNKRETRDPEDDYKD